MGTETQDTSSEEQKTDFEYRYGFSMPEKSIFKSQPGISREIVEQISSLKKEAQWMREFRLKAYGKIDSILLS